VLIFCAVAKGRGERRSGGCGHFGGRHRSASRVSFATLLSALGLRAQATAAASMPLLRLPCTPAFSAHALAPRHKRRIRLFYDSGNRRRCGWLIA
jgi:hypothetical protein